MESKEKLISLNNCKANLSGMIIMLFALTLGAVVLGIGDSAQGATINAASCSQADVQAAIDSAVTGDIVLVPAEECTWTAGVSILNSKKITLQGAGIDSTIINRSPYATAINMGQSGSRVTGFTINEGYVTTDGDGWRVDHCKFYRASSFGQGVYVRGVRSSAAHPTGLVDNCSFYNTRVLIYGTAAMLHENDWQHVLWTTSLDLGTNNNVVYVEDCYFEFNVFGNAIDANYGGAYVFRFNHISHVYIELHSVQGTNRATRRWEIYGNTIDNPGSSIYYPYRIRGGTGVVFNDTLVGAWTNYGIALDNVRSYAARGDGGMCTGGSLWDGNEALITGTHTGDNGETNLTDLSKTWETDELLYSVQDGTHTGDNNASILTTTINLTDSENDRVGQLLHNLTDGSWGVITSNTNYTATCTLTGGTENDWDTGDSFKITGGYWIYNLTSGAKCQIVSNSANAVVGTLVGGDRQTWNTGDTYKISNGYPSRDQIGRGPDNPQWDHNPPGAYTQPLVPAYAWENRRLSNNALVPFKVINSGQRHIQANRDYYNHDASFDGTSGVGVGALANRPSTCTVGVGYWATDQGEWNSENPGADGQLYKCTSTDTWELYYTPYIYPHPLRGESGTDTTHPTLSNPDKFSLQQNYPNPFNPSTTICYSIPNPCRVRIKIYNQLGQLVRTLLNEDKLIGNEYKVTWDGAGDHGNKLASGVYYYRLTAGKQSFSKKMLYLR
ncbi:MAG: T9SS type A sorting domain-containing protein [Methanosarcinaceae archaeon]